MASILTLLFALSAFLDYPYNMIPNYAKLKKPPLKDVPCVRNEKTVTFQFSGFDFALESSLDFDSPPAAILKRNLNVVGTFKLASVYFDPMDCEIQSFDADNNGFTDVFVSYHMGPTGRNSSIQVVDAFFFVSDSTFKFVELASFYGGFQLFRDFNDDGKFEYACIRWENQAGLGRDFINLFSFSNGEYKNISSKTLGFPIALERSEDGTASKLKRMPNKSGWYLKTPNVLQKRK